MATRSSWVNCPHCGNRADFTYGRSDTYFGSPVSICQHCKNKYLNPWTVELAVKPKEWYKKHHRNKFIVFLLFILPVVVAFILQSKNIISPQAMFLGTIVVIVILEALYLYNTTSISTKTAGFEKSYEESEKRLSNEEYKKFLTDSGYMDTVKQTIRK